MLPLARKLRNFGLSAIALLLAASFALTGASIQTPDRLTRQQQRSRSQRSPRHRACPGLSQGHCVFHSTSVNAGTPSGTLPTETVSAVKPVFHSVEALHFAATPQPSRPLFPAPSLPRPPPARA